MKKRHFILPLIIMLFIGINCKKKEKFDFEISTLSDIELRQNSAIGTTVSISKTKGENEFVVLSYTAEEAVTAGISITLDPNSATSDFTSTVYISVFSRTPVGNYPITITATSASGIIKSITFNVKVQYSIDVTPPIITLVGPNDMTVQLNQPCADPGAGACDDRDGDLTSRVTSNFSTVVNFNLATNYTVTYSVADNAENTATKTRTVHVVVKQSNIDGIWSRVVQEGGTTYPAENEQILSSITYTDRILFNKFAGYTNLTPYGVISGTNGTVLDIPPQTFQNVGTSNITVTVYANGTIATDGRHMNINYSLNQNGTITTGTSDYTKQ